MSATTYQPENREQLAAHAQAARLIVSLRGMVRDVERAMQPVRHADAALRALLPLLSPAARAEINREIERLSTQFCEVFQPTDTHPNEH